MTKQQALEMWRTLCRNYKLPGTARVETTRCAAKKGRPRGCHLHNARGCKVTTYRLLLQLNKPERARVLTVATGASWEAAIQAGRIALAAKHDKALEGGAP